MNMKSIRLASASAVCVCAFAATAEMMDRPTGIKIGQRMTLRPYVSLSAAYDSNVGSKRSNAKGDVLWNINPGFTLDYTQEKWSLLLTANYTYHTYTKSRNDKYNEHAYGESLRWNWIDGDEVGKGWSMIIAESYRRVTMADDFDLNDGRAYNGDRGQFDINGGIQRRFNENWHANVYGGYYNLDYDNDTDKGNGLYGWQRWNASADIGFAPSRWTDFIAMIGYQGYNQDNAATVNGTHVGRRSEGYTAQLGIGSFATERISYRLLAGWSRFEYGNASNNDGFIYTGTLNWKISDTLQTMLVATSYYQPSEREIASASRVDSVSWGLHKSLVRGTLNATLDMTYRHENIERAYSSNSSRDYDVDVLSGRIGLNYTLNRFLTLFTYGEYLRSWDDSGLYDYDRWRVTGGVRLTY